MKKILSVALSTAMAFSMFASVAFGADAKLTPEQQFNALKDAGIVSGFPDGLSHLEKTLTRAELAKIIVNSLSLEPVDATSYNDKNYAKHWGRTYIEAATQAGILNGKDAAKKLFDPNGAVTVQELAKVLVTALKLEVPADANNTASAWAKGYVAAAVNAGYLAEGINYQAQATRSQAVVAAYAIYEAAQGPKVKSYKVVDSKTVEFTLSTDEVVKVTLEKALEPNKETEVTFKTKDGVELKHKVTYTVTALEVQSVTAKNLKQYEVTFNSPADVNETNFLINGAVVNEDDFSLSADKTVATLYNQATPAQGAKIKVTVQNYASAAETTKKTTFHDLVVNDNALPTVTSVETVGNSLVKVNFSEPVQDAAAKTISNYTIGGVIRAGNITLSKNNQTALIALSNALPDGDYELVVSPSNVVDFANHSIGLNKTSFKITKDTEVPAISVVSATQEQVKVKFAKDVKLNSDLYLYWKNGSTKVSSAVGVQDKTDSTVYTFTFSAANRLPSGTTDVYVNKVSDYSGNSKSDYQFSVTATVDNARPVFQSITQKSATTFEVKYSKAVVGTSGNYVFTDSKNVTYTASSANKAGDNTVVVLTVSGLNTDRNPYSLSIKNVIDTTYLQNKIEDTITSVTVADQNLPSVTSATQSGRVVSVTFSEPIDPASVTTANFKYLAGGGFNDLPSAAYIEFVGQNTVNITFPVAFGPSNTYTAATLVGAGKLYVSDVKDLAGNKIIATANNVSAAGVSVGLAGSIYLVDSKTILFESATPLTAVYTGDFVVTTAAGETLALDNAELVNADADVNKYAATAATGHALTGFAVGDQLVKLTLTNAIDANGQKAGSAIRVATAPTVTVSKTAVGTPIAFATTTASDKVIPGAPVDTKFAFNNATNVVSVASAFATDEAVTVEIAYGTSAPAVTATAAASDIFSGANALYSTQTFTAAPNAGENVYVRFVDAASNKSDWVKIGQKVPVATTATFVFTSATQGTLAGLTANVDEYSTDGGSTWTLATGATVTGLTPSVANDIKVRVAATSSAPAGTVQTIDILATPAAPSVIAVAGSAAGKTVVAGSTTAMEYSVDGGTTWIDFASANEELTVPASTVIQVRVKASAAGTTNIAPEGAIASITAL